MSDTTGRVTANIHCFGAMLLWASGFVSLEFLLADWGALSLNAVRFVVSAGFLVIWWLLREGVHQAFQVSWWKGLFIGALGWGVGSIFLYLGQRMSDPVTTTIVVAMMPIAGAAIEMIFDGRRLSLHLLAGIALAVAGGYLAAGASFHEGTVGTGMALCVVAIFLFAWATRATTRELETLTRPGQAAVTLSGGALILVLLYLGALPFSPSETKVGAIDAARFWPFIIFVLPSAGIAQLMWIYGAGKLGVMLASFHMNAVPFYVMVILLALSMGDWEWLRAAGVAVVILGVLISQIPSGINKAQTQS